MKKFITLFLIGFSVSVMAEQGLEFCHPSDAVCVGRVLLQAINQSSQTTTVDIISATCEDRDNDGRYVFYQLAQSNGTLKEERVYGLENNEKFTQKMCNDIVSRVPKTCGRPDRTVQFFACQDSDLNGEWVLVSIIAANDGRPWVKTNVTEKLAETACRQKLANLPGCVF